MKEIEDPRNEFFKNIRHASFAGKLSMYYKRYISSADVMLTFHIKQSVLQAAQTDCFNWRLYKYMHMFVKSFQPVISC